MIAVTGSTGLVGTHLLAHLATSTEKVSAFYRTQTKREEALKVIRDVYGDKTEASVAQMQWVQLDILDVQALSTHLRDVDQLYHCAGKISNRPAEIKMTRKVNIEGTANVMNIALKLGISKVCHVSSVAALGHAQNGKIEEDSVRDNNRSVSNYSIAKYGAEMEAWRATQEGLNVVIVNPGIIIGEGFYDTGCGKLLGMVRSGTSFYVDKVGGFVDVKDVARSMIELMEHETFNSRYILVAENLSFKKVMQQLAGYLGQRPPKIKLRKSLLYVFWLLELILALFKIKKRLLTRQMINELHSKTYYDNTKVRESLHFKFTPIQETLKRVAQHLASQA